MEADHTQDFAEIVVPIASWKIVPSLKVGITGTIGPKFNLDANFGTGFCLDAPCRFIVTNYHVALMTPAKKIKKEQIIRRYLATGPHDPQATFNDMGKANGAGFAMKRDLAIFELRNPLAGHHGLSFSLDELYAGQEVDIYGFPRGVIAPIRKLTRFRARFNALTTSGLLAFDYELSGNASVRVEGSSGGIVVDRKTQKIIAIMSASNATMALAIPVQTLVDFVKKVQPFLAEKIFPTIKDTELSIVSGDLHPKLVPDPRIEGHRPAEPREVTVLRQKAQTLADTMQNFVAVQDINWGEGDKEPFEQADYEVRVINGTQSWRKYPGGKRDLPEVVPSPHWSYWVSTSDEWSALPNMVGTNLRLKLHQAEDSVLNGRRLKIFQYYSDVEDNLCPLSTQDDFALFSTSNLVAVACYGEVWADEDSNIIRISEHLDLSDKLRAYRGWDEYEFVITYGLFKRGDEPSIRVPLTVFVQGRHKKHIAWCRGHFRDYKVFETKAKLIVKEAELVELRKTLSKSNTLTISNLSPK
jgi:hypothetical protein